MAQNSPIKKSPVKSPVNVKTHQEALGFLFGRNLSTFEHLLEGEEIRPYKLPKLNPNAESYDQMIDWNNEELSEPRPTMSITNTDLLKIGFGEKKLPSPRL